MSEASRPCVVKMYVCVYVCMWSEYMIGLMMVITGYENVEVLKNNPKSMCKT